MRVFRASPFPTARLLGTSPRGLINALMTARIPWSQGKMQGISRNQPLFAKILLENIREFSRLRMNSLLEQSREFFCQRREIIRRAGNEQGIRRKTDPRDPTHPMASKYSNVTDINSGCKAAVGDPLGCFAALDRNREHGVRGSPRCHTRESGYPAGRDAAAQGLRLAGAAGGRYSVSVVVSWMPAFAGMTRGAAGRASSWLRRFIQEERRQAGAELAMTDRALVS